MSEIFEAFLVLYRIDRKILELRKELQALPGKVADREKEVALAREQRQAIETSIQEKTRQLDERNLDIRSHTDELRDLEEKMRFVKNNKEYRIFSDRIRELKQTISDLETAALLIMEDLDKLRQDLVAKQNAVAACEQQVEEVKKNCEAEAARIRQELQGIKQQRDEAIAKIKALSDSAMEVYETAYRRTHGDAMAELLNGICQACFQKQSPNVENMVLVGRELKKCRCASCGRILYIKPSAGSGLSA